MSTTYVLMLYKMPFKITGLGQAFQTTSRAYDSMGAVSARTCKFLMRLLLIFESQTSNASPDKESLM